ncbi:hypothetical protein CKAH01_02161 [Colletotrichum kahawae]|uniref:Uncharacterized protein n=1 Tax=Colletotrichum kahawae TaxID=34407 RepID=A0AAD9Y0D6_COLKA|nr:hypothetical protein CKAH01_02161 [Colletotrichum kahawae]
MQVHRARHQQRADPRRVRIAAAAYYLEISDSSRGTRVSTMRYTSSTPFTDKPQSRMDSVYTSRQATDFPGALKPWNTQKEYSRPKNDALVNAEPRMVEKERATDMTGEVI